MVDDERMPIAPNEVVETRSVRFRTLGCYPLTAAIESTAATLDDLIAEMEETKLSERAGRLIDGARSESMEAKKQEGYF
jgi:sulfate adenylyltransferase subunit 2